MDGIRHPLPHIKAHRISRSCDLVWENAAVTAQQIGASPSNPPLPLPTEYTLRDIAIGQKAIMEKKNGIPTFSWNSKAIPRQFGYTWGC